MLPGVSELVVARAHFRQRSIIFASVYLAPCNRYSAPKFDEWLDSLASWLASLGTDISELILMGDLKLAPGDSNFARMWDLLNSFGLISIVNEPMHGGSDIPRKQIDHVFVGSPLLGGKCYLAPPLEKRASGHSCIAFSPISLSAARSKCANRTAYLFKNTDLPKARFLLQYLRSGDLRDLSSEVSARQSADEAADFLLREIADSFRMSTPLSKVSSNMRGPSLDPDIIKLVHQRHRAYAAWKNGDYHKSLL